MSSNHKTDAARARVAVPLTDKDLKRLRLLAVKTDTSVPSMMREAMNEWLKTHGHKELESL